MSARKRARLIFVTGTDTGVGKTLATAMLLTHLRAKGINTLALKPFCSGSRYDAELLFKLQGQQLPLRVINPCFYRQPVAPLAAAGSRPVTLEFVSERILSVADSADVLLVEGAGGLLVPLGKEFTVADLIASLPCTDVVVVAQNRLGTINHTLLTIKCLRQLRCTPGPTIRVVLMEPGRRDPSSQSNARILRAFLPRVPVISVPFLGTGTQSTPSAVKKNCAKIQKTLARILA